MVGEKSATRRVKTKERRPVLEDRERMTEKALSAIRQTGTAAALEKCRGLADQINAELLQSQVENLIEPSTVAELQAYLARAAAVLKKL
jgi:hypothetical protein